MISVLSLLSSGSTGGISREVFYQVFEIWVEAQFQDGDVDLGFIGIRAAFKSPAWRKPEEHQHSNNGQKKKKRSMCVTENIHKEYLQFEKNVKLPLYFSKSQTHAEKQASITYTISQELFVCISSQPMFSNISLVPSHHLWQEYLHHRNWSMLQVRISWRAGELVDTHLPLYHCLRKPRNYTGPGKELQPPSIPHHHITVCLGRLPIGDTTHW